MSDPFEKIQDSQDKQEPDKYRRAAEMVRRFMQKSQDYRKPYLERASRAKEDYLNWLEISKSPIRRANLHVAYPFMVVQHEIPQLIMPFFTDPLPFRLLGEEVQDMNYEFGLTQYLGNQLRSMQLRAKYVSHVHHNCVEGTAISKVPYRFLEKTAIQRIPVQEMDGSISFVKEEVQVPVYDGPYYENIDLADFFPDWTVREPGEIQEMRGCVHRLYRTLDELERNQKVVLPNGEPAGVYVNLKQLKDSVRVRGVNAWTTPSFSTEFEARHDIDLKKEFNKPIEVWEYWGLFDRNDDGNFEEFVIAIANGDVCIRLDINPYDYRQKPFVSSVNIPVSGEWYGMSELMPLRGHVKELSALRNARLDSINLSVNRMWKVSRTAGINPNSLVFRPDGIIYTNDMQGVEPVVAPDVPPSVHKEIQDLGSEIQQISGSSTGPSVQPIARVFGRTAAGVNSLESLSANRIAVKLLLLAELHWKPLVEQMLAINSQYITEIQYTRITGLPGNPFLELPQEAFHTRYDFEVLPSIFASAAEEQQKLQMGLQFLQVVEQSQPGRVDFEKFFEDFAHSIFGKRAQRFIRSNEELMQIQMQQLAAEQATNAAIGQAAPQPNEGMNNGGIIQ